MCGIFMPYERKDITMKKQNDYFEMMERLAGFGERTADLLTDILNGFDASQIQARRDEMHRLEHEADEARHETLRKLSREFITPIERDDILQLVQIIDDVTDAIDEVVINLYTYDIRRIPPDALKLAGLVTRCVKALHAALAELRHFKKSETLKPLLIEVNSIESEADGVYTEALRALFTSGEEPLIILGVREIYHGLESCCDLCEHAADVIENTVMKNT